MSRISLIKTFFQSFIILFFTLVILGLFWIIDSYLPLFRTVAIALGLNTIILGVLLYLEGKSNQEDR